MCSTQSRRLPSLVAQLHDLLGAMQSAVCEPLGDDEHEAALAALVSAKSRLHSVTTTHVGNFDSQDVAGRTIHHSTRRWLEQSTRLSSREAAHLARTSRALRDHLPSTRAALAEGAITESHVAAICTVVREVGSEHAQPADGILSGLARKCDAASVRRATSEIIALVDPAKAEDALDRAYHRRGLTLSVVGSHAYVRGVLDADSAEVLESAFMPLMTPATGETRTAPQRRADALIDLAKRALDAGELPVLGGRRPHVSVVVDEDALRNRTGSVTLPWTGEAIPVGRVAAMLCDASVSPVLARRTEAGWLPLAVGRSARTATAAQVRALVVRDGGCIHPGCSRTAAFCDAHHVQHWLHGGGTDLDNLVLLCRHHHRTLHAGHWSLRPEPATPGRFVTTIAGIALPGLTAADRSPPVAHAVEPPARPSADQSTSATS